MKNTDCFLGALETLWQLLRVCAKNDYGLMTLNVVYEHHCRTPETQQFDVLTGRPSEKEC